MTESNIANLKRVYDRDDELWEDLSDIYTEQITSDPDGLWKELNNNFNKENEYEDI